MRQAELAEKAYAYDICPLRDGQTPCRGGACSLFSTKYQSCMLTRACIDLQRLSTNTLTIERILRDIKEAKNGQTEQQT